MEANVQAAVSRKKRKSVQGTDEDLNAHRAARAKRTRTKAVPADERGADDDGNGEPSYIVEAILDGPKRKKHKQGFLQKYFVKWEGWDADQNTWEPAENLPSGMITEYTEKVEAQAKADADAAISAAARARDPNYGPLSQQAKSQAKQQSHRSRRSAKADGGDIEPVNDKEVSSTIG